MTEKDIFFNFKGRYYTLGEITADTKQIWFVLHGYGQLAQFFLKKFNVLEASNIYVIAPEGLSKFYLEELQTSGRRNNRVGATWMTRENRLTDIENYIHYLNDVYKTEIRNRNIPVTILGFSQGSATATRWALSGQAKFNRLILWAGIFPPDMDFNTASEILKTKEIFLVYGEKDPFLNDARFAEMESLAKKLDAPITEITFDGKHDIHEETLKRLAG